MTQQRLTQGPGVTVRREKHARPDLVYPMKVHHDDGDHIVVVGPFVTGLTEFQADVARLLSHSRLRPVPAGRG